MRFLLLLIAFASLSQDVTVSSDIDKKNILVGEQTTLTFTVVAPHEYNILWPEIHDTIVSEVEVLSRTETDTSSLGDKLSYTRSFVLTSFDSGYYAIPGYVFNISSGSDSALIESNAILLEVHGVAIDTTAAIKSIAPILPVPITFKEILDQAPKYGLIALIVLAIAAAVYALVHYKKHKKIIVLPSLKPTVPPNRTALDALYALEKKKLWQCGETKKYYAEITDILRSYIAGAFGIPAVEMITEDIFVDLSRNDKCFREDKLLAQEIFSLSDMVKFAKRPTEPEENQEVLKQAYEFVNHSWNNITTEEKEDKHVE